MDVSFPLPLGRSKGLTLRQDNLNSTTCSIHGGESLGVTPPAGETRIAQTDSEEHDDQTQRSTDIQASGDNIVVLHPPTTPAVANELVEHETNTTPHKICEGSSGGNHASTAENQGSVQELGTALGPFASNNPDNGRQGESGEPEPLEASVHLANGEHALGTDDTPDDGGVEEDAAVGAGVVVCLMGVANIANATERPVCPEGDTRGDLHVVTCNHVRIVKHKVEVVGFEGVLPSFIS